MARFLKSLSSYIQLSLYLDILGKATFSSFSISQIFWNFIHSLSQIRDMALSKGLQTIFFAHQVYGKKSLSRAFPIQKQKGQNRIFSTSATVAPEVSYIFFRHFVQLIAVQMVSMDGKWDVDSFNLTEATTLGEFISNLTNLGEFSG